MTIKLGSADLSYLLQQVNISNDYSQLGSSIHPSGVREVAGSNNNLVGGFSVNADGNFVWNGDYSSANGQQEGTNGNADWGQADTNFLRLFDNDHPNNGTSYGITYDAALQFALPDSQGRTFVDTDWEPTFASNVMGSIVIEAPGTSARTITQLISSSDVDPTSPTYNAAAAAVMEKLGGQPVDVANAVVGTSQTASIPNPGILGGVTYNDFFVTFGQFFDHGLDFITKGAGFVLIPLSPNDPLYDPEATGPTANMMMLNRAALTNPADDFDIDASGNTTLKAGVQPEFNNNTGLMVDQSQTYGSHEAVNAILREFDTNGVLTGRLISGDINGGNVHDLADWAGMKVNAVRVGIELGDMDVLDFPAIKADAVGRLLTADWEAETGTILDPGVSFIPQQAFLYRSNETLVEMMLRTGETLATLEAHDPFFRHPVGTLDSMGNDISGEMRFTNQPILADISPTANPNFHHDYLTDANGAPILLATSALDLTPTIVETVYNADGTVVDHTGLTANVYVADGVTTFDYNPALLARHKVSGDGRVNENIGLTAIHNVWHEEHNIQSQNVKDAVTAQATVEYQASYDAEFAISGNGAAADVAGLAAQAAYLSNWQTAPGVWDGEKVYQAARIITESEYNHIAIDQYVGGLYPALPEFVAYSTDINLSISLEFSQAVFRLGHSQLNEQMQIATSNATGTPGDPGYIPNAASMTHEDLFDVFLNPDAYNQYGPSAIVLGMMNQQGNEMDEFVTSALQQTLVGIPLDLAALNLARGRDVGLPTLNELRQQAFDGLTQNTNNNSNGSGLAPYSSWSDFGGSMRNPESLVNFIAAYADDEGEGVLDFGIETARKAYEAGSATLQDIRDVTQTMLDGWADGSDANAVTFMEGNGGATYVGGNAGVNGWVFENGAGDQGFWNIDLWIGGLAEQPLFDGPLGTTFSFVILDFAQRLQDGDRFYYLYRMPVGQHLGDQIIGEQFHDLIMRTTGLENLGDAFGTMSATYYLDSGADLAVDGMKDTDFGSFDDGDNSIHDYFNAIQEPLPDSTRNLVVANKSFENDDLTAGNTNNAGTILPGTAPAGWSKTGGVSIWVPDTETVIDPDVRLDPTGMSGEQVVQLAGNGRIYQDLDYALIEGASYELSFNLGNRVDRPGGQVSAKLIAADGTEIASTIAAVGADGWTPVTLSTADLAFFPNGIDAAQAGQGLRIEIQKVGNDFDGDTGGPVAIIENVNVIETVPGESANDGHILVIGGTGNDFIKGALGDDYLYGNEDNDVIEGAQGNDHIYGGAGNDWITDYENDDFIHGGAGNDYIAAGPGVLDTSHGGEGNDEVHGGDGIDEVFGNDGDDMLFGEGDTDLMEGGDGNDYIDGGDSVDEIFAGDGNDWMRGGVGDDHMNGGSGNDLMEGGGGPVANDGDRYFGDQGPVTLPVIEFNGDGTIGEMDIASYENLSSGVVASLQTWNAAGTNSNLLDQYAFVDGLVGSSVGDILEGGQADAVASNGADNQLIGGGGDDELTGLGGNDIIIGDAAVVRNDLWFDLDASLYREANGETDGTTFGGIDLDFIEDWGAFDLGITSSNTTTGEARVVFNDIPGGELGHILGEDGAAGNDVAIYRGNRTDYNVIDNLDGTYTVEDTRLPDILDPVTGEAIHDGTDTLFGVEHLRFADTVGPDLAIAGAVGPAGPGGGVNLPPVASGVAPITPALPFPATPVNITFTDLLAATTDPDMDTMQILNVDIAVGAGGIALLSGTGGLGSIWTYTPEIGDTNDDVFEVEVTDGINDPVIVTASLVLDDEPAPPTPPVGTINGTNEDDTFVNTAADESFFGFEQGDTLPWAPGDGVDFFDGGDGTDIFQVNGNGDAETYNVYAPDATDYTAEGGDGGHPGSLLVTRTVGTIVPVTTVIARVLNVEELIFNLGAGDTLATFGNFAGLIAQDTITINSDGGHVVVDISQMLSNEHVVLNAGTGTYEIINSDMNAVTVNSDATGGTPPTNTGGASAAGVISGTDAAVLFGTVEADIIIGTDDNMVIYASNGDDIVTTGNENAIVFGGSGDDLIDSNDGNDIVFGDDDIDTILTGSGNDKVWGGAGGDLIDVGDGNDIVFGDAGEDDISGGAGNDWIWGDDGADRIDGGVGDDRIEGGAGADTLIGGKGNDTFVFRSVADADGDRIGDFAPGDRIDLHFLDANYSLDGNNAFTLQAGGTFTAAGELIVHTDSSGNTIIEGNTDADLTTAEFNLTLDGDHVDELVLNNSIIL